MEQKPIPASFYGESWHANNKFWVYGDNEAGKRKSEGDAPRLIMKCFSKPFSQLRVLDVGGGRGWLSKFLVELGADVVCLDYSSWSIKHSVVPGKSLLGDMTNLPFKNSSFDLVISRENMEHLTVEQADRAFAEMVRVTNKWIYMTIWLTFASEAKDDEIYTDFENDLSHITVCTRNFWQRRFNEYVKKDCIIEDIEKEKILDWRGKGRVWVFEKLKEK